MPAARKTLEDLLSDLAAQRRVTSARTGEGGAKSDAYRAFEALTAAIDPAQERALLLHRSPVVRAFLGGHVGQTQPGALEALAPLLRDRTAIKVQYGCRIGRESVASHVAAELCDAISLGLPTAGEAEALLHRVAADARSPARERAAQCVANLPQRP